jgi:esterase
MAIELTYRKLGDETVMPPLVILHGLLGSAGNWRTIARDLLAGRTVYCLNLRNHGDAPHAPTMSYPEMAEDVESFIGTLNSANVDLLGHSMGGKVAMAVAFRKPELLNRLVVVDTAPVAYSKLNLGMFDGMCQVDLSIIESRDDADRQMQSIVGNSVLRSFVLTNLRRTKDMGFEWRVNVQAIREALPEIIGFPEFKACEFSGPTCFLGGELSGYIKDYGADIERFFPQAITQLVPRAGHWPHADDPATTVRILKAFLDGGAE